MACLCYHTFKHSNNSIAGYYCYAGSTNSTPAIGAEGGYCTAGYYCPEGSANPTICDPGLYCETDYLPSPTGNCSGGKSGDKNI